MSLPTARRFAPAPLVRPGGADLARPETPFGYAYWQVLCARNVGATAASIAAEIGADARAVVHVEPLLRWRLTERDRAGDREPAVLSHRALCGAAIGETAPTDSRHAIGDGVLLLVACQLVLPIEAVRTYRDVFTSQPLGATLSPLVAVASLRSASTAPRTDAERARRNTLVTRFGAAGETLFAASNTSCPTTLDVLGSLGTASTAAPVDAAPVLRDDADDSDDMTMDALARRPGAPAAAPEPVVDSAPTAWCRSCIAAGKYRIDVIVRGYVTRARVATARRLAAADDLFYVLPPFAVHATADAALADAAVATDAPPEPAAAPQVDAPVEPPTWNRHLLDRLTRLDLARLTYYEVDRATRDRFSLHAHLDAYRRRGTPLEQRGAIVRYPSGYGAPVLQPYAAAPGLLGAQTSAHDYAAVGLGGLCIAAAVEPSLRQWLLDAEAYFFRLRRRAASDAHVGAYVGRIDELIDRCAAPPDGSELAELVRDIVDAASAVIAGIDACAVPPGEASESDASDDEPPDDADETESAVGDCAEVE